MATISNQLGPIDVYHFNSVGNAFRNKETRIIPLPADFYPCHIGPDGVTEVKTKILYHEGGIAKEAYVGQTVAELEALTKNT